MNTTGNITEPVKATTQTSSFRLLLAAAAAALVLPFVIPIICNLLERSSLFTLEDATNTKNFFWGFGRYFLATLGVGGTIGTVGSSLSSRIAKLAAQLAPGIPTAVTPNGEGIGALASLGVGMLGSVAPQFAPAVSAARETTGFDITDYNIGAPMGSASTYQEPPSNGVIDLGELSS